MSCATSSIPVYDKDPNAVLWYGVTWVDYLAQIGADSIATSTWIVPVGLTNVAEQIANPIAKVKLSGGTVGESYDVVNRITTTASAETEDRTIRIFIRER